jgi:hypothetical protein
MAAMPISVRPLRDDELRTDLEIHTSAVRGLAVTHYGPDAIAGWVGPITGATLRDLASNEDGRNPSDGRVGRHACGQRRRGDREKDLTV